MRMYDKGIIGYAYKPIQTVRSKVRWQDIANTYGIKKGFDRVIRHLFSKGYVGLRGKAGDVCSLTALGVSYVRGKLVQSKEQ